MLLQDTIAEWVRRTPDRAAVVGRGGGLTYGELDALANRFARAFIADGLQPGDRVALYVQRSAVCVAAMLGTLRAGGAYVPIDPHSPSPRAGLIVSDCGVRILVTSSVLAGKWSATGAAVANVVLVDEEAGVSADRGVRSWRSVLATSAAAVPRVARGDGDLAYVLYTSGSTGVPKGVMISHRNALAFVDWAAGVVDLNPDDRVANHAPFHFDLSVFDLYSTLSRGGTVHILDDALAASGRGMVEKLHADEITIWYSVPSALMLMLEQGDLEAMGAAALRAIVFAGEVFPVGPLRRLMRAVPQARYLNFFGPTETNVCVYHELREPPPPEAKGIPIGRAASGARLTVVGKDGRAVTAGEIGELMVDGPTVMLGYWSGGEAACPYPTGDLVSEDPEGNLLFHGRRDHMVKIRGFRIELGEVETVLQRSSRVRQAATIAAENRLVAFVAPAEASLSVLAVKRHCAGLLPRHMIPHEVHFVDDLPRNANGKVDRSVLAAMRVEFRRRATQVRNEERQPDDRER